MRLITSLGLSLVIWTFVFLVSLEGFTFLQRLLPLSGDIIGTVFDVMFLSLGVLLSFSTGIMLYASLFASPEAGFLLTCPVTADRIFAYKYQSALFFSSWGFVLIGSPVLLAYGLVYRQPTLTGQGQPASLLFFALLPLFFLGFILIPGTVGSILCLLIVNVFPRRRMGVLLLAGAIVAAVAIFLFYRFSTTVRTSRWNPDLLQRLIGQVSFAQDPMMPSHWIGRGLRASARGEFGPCLFHLSLLWSNGLLGYVTATWLAGRIYRRGYNRLTTGTEMRRRRRGTWLDAWLSALLWPLHPQTRLLIVKDCRLFRREPTQWALVAFFCGLLALYFMNVRRFFIGELALEDDPNRAWQSQNLISLINLFATSLLLCTYTGRFIFPALSLEGKRFWILGLLPLPRERLVWSKFAFSACGSAAIAEFLVVLSDVTLGVPWPVLAIHVLTIAILALGLSGTSVGLGALMPNFRETDPSRIAVGFGGTINVVLGLAFALLVLAVVPGPWHLLLTVGRDGNIRIASPVYGIVLGTGVALGLALGAAAVYIPLRVGILALKRMEF